MDAEQPAISSTDDAGVVDFKAAPIRARRIKFSYPQVDGFIGQEATHGREHREINEHLQEIGYPTRINDRLTKRALAMIYRHAPHKFSLAMTAGLEHYTATLASLLLTNTEARALLTSDEVRGLLLWHAYEEVEHKAWRSTSTGPSVAAKLCVSARCAGSTSRSWDLSPCPRWRQCSPIAPRTTRFAFCEAWRLCAPTRGSTEMYCAS